SPSGGPAAPARHRRVSERESRRDGTRGARRVVEGLPSLEANPASPAGTWARVQREDQWKQQSLSVARGESRGGPHWQELSTSCCSSSERSCSSAARPPAMPPRRR